jgi:hypothetical protein
MVALCYRKLGWCGKLMATLNGYACVGGLEGVPSLRGKLLEVHTGIHTISAVGLPS